MTPVPCNFCGLPVLEAVAELTRLLNARQDVRGCRDCMLTMAEVVGQRLRALKEAA